MAGLLRQKRGTVVKYYFWSSGLIALFHDTNGGPDAAMNSKFSHTKQEAQMNARPVEIVVSAPRIHPWILKLPGSQLLTSINTTHWGLKVGSSYHDLKMRGLFRTKPDVAFAPTLVDRDERAISKPILIGKTHFTDEEICLFSKFIYCFCNFKSLNWSSVTVLTFKKQSIAFYMYRGIISGLTTVKALQ